MTLRYAHLSPGFKQAAVERLDTYWTPDDTLRNVLREVESSKFLESQEEEVVGGTGFEPVTPTMSRLLSVFPEFSFLRIFLYLL